MLFFFMQWQSKVIKKNNCTFIHHSFLNQPHKYNNYNFRTICFCFEVQKYILFYLPVVQIVSAKTTACIYIKDTGLLSYVHKGYSFLDAPRLLCCGIALCFTMSWACTSIWPQQFRRLQAHIIIERYMGTVVLCGTDSFQHKALGTEKVYNYWSCLKFR